MPISNGHGDARLREHFYIARRPVRNGNVIFGEILNHHAYDFLYVLQSLLFSGSPSRAAVFLQYRAVGVPSPFIRFHDDFEGIRPLGVGSRQTVWGAVPEPPSATIVLIP